MWRKILKYKAMAKSFYRVNVNNGRHTSFWFDSWSTLGCIMDILGPNGYIDFRIRKDATVEEAMILHRRRRHRVLILNQIEEELAKFKKKASREDDIGLWKQRVDIFKSKFSSKLTWDQMRTQGVICEWSKGIWFTFSISKFAFLTWIALRNRLSTGDKMLRWGVAANTACSLCDEMLETRNHLFFDCRYSVEV